MQDIKVLTEELVRYIIGFLPTNTGESVKINERDSISSKLLTYRNEVINDFCKKHNICPVCIKGGWNCNSEHK